MSGKKPILLNRTPGGSVFRSDGDERTIADREGIRGSSERGPPKDGQGSGLLFTPAKGDAAEPRGSDEVSESLPARVLMGLSIAPHSA
jgi:hypothetical protein